MHASMVTGAAGIHRGPFQLYDFVNDSDRAFMLERGLLPWWSHPRLTIRFWRPLSSALRYAELRALGPDALLVPHLHSFGWWCLATLAAWALFSRLLAARPALLATAIFALGPWHVLPIAWLANREVLLSLSFGLTALLAQLRLRDEGRLRDAALALFGYTLAFGSGEYAFCLAGYVLAAELVVRRGSLVARTARLVPYALPAFGYLVVRHVGGYGTYASAFYADPISEPGKTLMLAPQRLSLLLAEGWLTLGTDAWGTTAAKWLVACLVIVSGIAVVLTIRHVFAALPRATRANATFFLLGSCFALLPIIAAVPAPRLLGMSAFGMAAVIALIVEHAWFPEVLPARRGLAELTGIVATLLAFLQLVHGPAASILAGEGLRQSSAAFQLSVAALGKKLVDDKRTDVSVVRGAGGAFFGHFALANLGVLPRWRILSHTPHALMLRKDAYSIELVAPASDGLYPQGPTNLFRDPGHPLKQGDVVELPGLRVEILQVGPKGPKRALYTFAQPLEDASYAWIDERNDGLREVPLPHPGFGKTYDP